MYWHRARFGLEHVPFVPTVAEQLDPAYPAERARYTRRTRCARGVARYFDLFGANVRVVVLEELAREFRRELADVFAFLGVDPAVADRIPPERHHPFVRPRGRFAARLLASERARRAARAVVPYTLRWPIERRLVAARVKPPIDPETDRLLREFFAQDVRELTTLLGRPLPWPRWHEATAEDERFGLARIAARPAGR